MEVRRRKTVGPHEQPLADPQSTPIPPGPHSLTNQEAEDQGLQPLTFMPLMLQTGSICSMLVFNLVVLGLLLALWYYDSFSVSNQWGYLAIQILPPALGTITASLIQGIAINLSRMTPYMLAAAPAGSTFHKTLLASYFPGLSLRDAVAAGSGLLAAVWILEFLFAMVLSFKSALLNTTDYRDYVVAIVTPWALYALIAIYILMAILTTVLACKMHNRVTGLRWDTASIADCLALFRYSDFLDEFEGTDIAARESIHNRLEHNRLKLGYWRQGDVTWHGFRSIPSDMQAIESTRVPLSSGELPLEAVPEPSTAQTTENDPQPSLTKSFSSLELSSIRYRSVDLNMEHWMAYIWVAVTLLLLAGFITMLALGFVQGKTVPISYNWATVIFQFFPTFFVSYYTWFWQDVDHFAQSTQPFKGMSSPGPASENLLLDYTTLPHLVVTYVALKNEHKRVAWTSFMAVLQRLLPIITAGATTIVPGNTNSTVYASKPLFIFIVVWLGLYCFLIPLEIFGWPLSRHNVDRRLPRSYSSISDLLSWVYASKLLRKDDGTPFEVPLKGPKAKQWYMTTRLMLVPQHNDQDSATYSFGLYESTKHKGIMCMGFDVASNVSPVEVGRGRKEDVEAKEGAIDMLAPDDLECVLEVAKERPTNVQTLLTQRVPHQQEQEEAQTEAA